MERTEEIDGRSERVEVPEALRAFVGEVAKRSQEVTDAQLAELREVGYSEDQIFEAIVVAAAGAASAHLEAAHRAMGGA